MIPCTAANVKNRPPEIPEEKWIELGEKYHIVYATRCLPQNVLAYSLYEKPLDESCHPFEYFISTRFHMKLEDALKVIEMYKDLGEVISEGAMQELFENSGLVER